MSTPSKYNLRKRARADSEDKDFGTPNTNNRKKPRTRGGSQNENKAPNKQGAQANKKPTVPQHNREVPNGTPLGTEHHVHHLNPPSASTTGDPLANTMAERNNYISSITIRGEKVPIPGVDPSRLPEITHLGPSGFSTAQNALEYNHDDGHLHLYIAKGDLDRYLYGDGLRDHGLSRHGWAFHLELEDDAFKTDGEKITMRCDDDPDVEITKWTWNTEEQGKKTKRETRQRFLRKR